MLKKRYLLLLLIGCYGAIWGCSNAYYGAMEKFGVHKRDIMVDRVGEARDAQEGAKEQFEDALEQFTHVLALDGGNLQEQYTTLHAAYEKSKRKAENVHKRIDSVENVSQALFNEWEEELKLYSNDVLRDDSAKKLTQTQQEYTQLITAMHRAEDKIKPVLRVFRDQVLYLKHNLNAQAIASLKGELVSLEGDVARLVREMEAAIREADRFILKLQSAE